MRPRFLALTLALGAVLAAAPAHAQRRRGRAVRRPAAATAATAAPSAPASPCAQQREACLGRCPPRDRSAQACRLHCASAFLACAMEGGGGGGGAGGSAAPAR